MAGKPRRDLNDKQELYAKWLALPPLERSPGTQIAMAKELGVTNRTLRMWQKLPHIHKYIVDLYTKRLVELVGPATNTLELAIAEPKKVSRVSFDAARYIVQDWAKKQQGPSNIVRNIVDMYERYHPGDKLNANR